MLKVDNIDVYYGAIHAIKGISIEVPKGEIVTLVGSNGAGKSTTLRTISGLMKPKNGTILFEDKNIVGVPAHKIVGMGLCQVPEGRHVFANMSVMENLELGAYCVMIRMVLPAIWKTFLKNSLDCWNVRTRFQERFPAVSSKCWLWDGL